MKTIVINSSNDVQNYGNKYVYNFPQTSHFPSGSGIGVSSVAIYNSITAKRGNKKITLNWLSMDYVFFMEDG